MRGITVKIGPILVILTTIALSGCASGPAGGKGGLRLPFVVHLKEIRPPGVPLDDEEIVTPANFAVHAHEWTALFRDALEEAGTFVEVVTGAGEFAGGSPDLELEVSVLGRDFGPGKPVFGGAVMSTIVWFLTGHLSWFIDDRAYPASEVRIRAAMRIPGSDEPEPVFTHDLLVSDLRLSLMDRLDVGTSFQNILLPPWSSAGNRMAAGSSLAWMAMEEFARLEPEQIAERLPENYLEKCSSYLVHEPERRAVVIISRKELRGVRIVPAGGPARFLSQARVDAGEIRGEAREEIMVDLLRRNARINTERAFYYYRFPLGDDARGRFGISAVLDGETDPRWTISQPVGVEEEDGDDSRSVARRGAGTDE